MSKVYATMNGFVGHKGQSVWLSEGDEYDTSDSLVKEQPQHFTAKTSTLAAVAEAKRRRPAGG